MAGGYCTVSGCDHEEEAGGLCFGHRYRQRHGLSLSTPLKERVPPFERVIDAMEAYFQADTDEDYHRAKARLRAANWDWLDPDGHLRRLARRRRAGGRKRLPRRREG